MPMAVAFLADVGDDFFIGKLLGLKRIGTNQSER
jgi:hypothetical protein